MFSLSYLFLSRSHWHRSRRSVIMFFSTMTKVSARIVCESYTTGWSLVGALRAGASSDIKKWGSERRSGGSSERKIVGARSVGRGSDGDESRGEAERWGARSGGVPEWSGLSGWGLLLAPRFMLFRVFAVGPRVLLPGSRRWARRPVMGRSRGRASNINTLNSLSTLRRRWRPRTSQVLQLSRSHPAIGTFQNSSDDQ